MMTDTVLPRPYPRQMQNVFLRLGDAFAAARGEPATADEFRHRRQWQRQRLGEALGLWFASADLDPEVTGVLAREGCRIEKVRYQSQPDFWVTAALYVPTRAPLPAPGILCPHGHWSGGRYHPEVQARLAGLAQRGYVVLSPDKVGYNEREPQGPHRSRNLFLVGQSVQGVQVWDNMRGIDYLCSRPEVDPGRIGCTGASGGGNQTMYLTALDERITAAAPVCSVELGECYLHKAFCTCETVPGLFTFADLVDIAGLAAPRPLLLVHGMLDEGFRLDSAQKAWRRLRRIYQQAGAEERLSHFLSYDGHAYNREMREAVYAWFDRWLMGREPPDAPEGDLELEPDPARSLRVCSGPLPGRGMLDLYAAAAAPPAAVQNASSSSMLERLDRVLVGPREAEAGGVPGGWPPRTPLRPHSAGKDRGEYAGVAADRERLYLFSEPDVVVPLIFAQPAGQAARAVTVHLSLEGKEAVPAEAIAADLAAGRGALLLDVRGTGETRPDSSPGNVWLASVILGRPTHGMRAWDLRRAVDWLLERGPLESVSLRAHGTAEAGLVALLAAVTDRRFASLAVEELLGSFRGQPDFGERGDWVIPHILEAGDIGDLLGLLAPRPAAVTRWVRADGSPAPAAEIDAAWAPYRAAARG